MKPLLSSGLLATALGGVAAPPAHAVGTFISAPSRVDMVNDVARHKIYISSGNQILRYDTDGEFFMPAVNLVGTLGGMDISPDGNTLAVANRTPGATAAYETVYLINLNASNWDPRTVSFPMAQGENGLWTVAYGSDGKLLISSRYAGSGTVPLRRYDPATQQVSIISGYLNQDTMLTASGDRTVIGLAESNASDGPWDIFRTADSSLTKRDGYTNGTSWFNYEIGVNNNGSQYAIPTYGGTFVYNSTYQKVATIGAYASGQPIGVAYHPTQPKIYFPWVGTNEIRVYDANSFQQIDSYNFESAFTSNGNHAFDNGRTKVSSDGSLLMSTVSGGVRYYRLSTPSGPSAAQSQSISINEDTSRTITLGNGPGTYTILSGPTKGTLTGSTPNLTYTPYLNYYGADSFTFALVDPNGVRTTATVSITVNGVADIPVAYDQTLDTPTGVPVSLILRATDGDDNGLTYSIVASPTKGTLSGTAPNLTYMPNPGTFGTDFFTFKANDGYYTSNTAKVWINITNPSGQAPSVLNNLYKVNRGSTLTVPLPGVLGNDTDPEGDPLRAVLFAPPTKAADFTLNGDGSFTWTGSSFSWLGSYASDSFTYRASDGSQLSQAATVTIQLNDPPTVDQTQNYTLAEDTARSFTLYASDRQVNDVITYQILTQPAHGTLSGTAPYLVYTPAANYFGPDSFTWRPSDGMAQGNICTTNFTVTPVNDAPVANAQSLTLSEDGSKSITLSGSDVEGSPLTYTVLSQSFHGTITGTAPNVVYTPAPNYYGSDSFTFKVNDGTVDSAVATISLTITPVADAPVAASQNVTTAEDTAKGITLSATDADGDALTYSVATQPAHGVLTGTAPDLTYTPDANYNGADSFTFKANDGISDSNVATVSINVTAVNDAPVALAQSVSTDEDTSKDIVLAGSDADGDTISFAVVTPPSHGGLTGTAPNLTYTPDANFNGSDSFTFKTNDGTVDSAVATVSITVKPVSDAPVAVKDSYNATEDQTLTVAAPGVIANDTDADGDALTAVLNKNADHGTVTLASNGGFTYVPDADYFGADCFKYHVRDEYIDSNIVTVTITVAAVNDAPVASAQSVAVVEDTAKTVVLSGFDAENDALTYTVTSQPSHGTLSGTAPNLTYTPNADYNGADSFDFKVNDGTVDSATATVSITVSAVNDAPVALAQGITTAEDTAKAVVVSGADADGDTLTYSIVSQPSHGTLLGTLPNLTYTPAADYNGADSFDFKVSDGTLSSTATVSIVVTGVNDAPTAAGASLTTAEDTALAVTLNGNDVDGDTLTYSITAQPAHGVLSGTAPNLIYTPAANYNGSDSFQFKVSDGTLSATATISVTVTAVNDAPLANTQNVTTAEDSAKSVVLSGSDVDGDTLTYSVTTQPAHGTLSGTAPNLTYTPAANYFGSDSISFQVSDGTLSASATVSITITPVNDAPTASNSSATTLEDTAKAITLSASDVDGDALTYSIVTAPTKGVLSGSGANLTYTPNLNANGSDSFVWKASDGTASVNATVSISITPVNDAPTASNSSVTTAQNTAVAVVLTGADLDGDALTYTIVSNPTKGTLSGTGANRTYTPNSGVSGTDSFTFKTSDATLSSAVATVSITINAAPAAGCVITYNITNQWPGGFTADVFIKNNGAAIANGWTLAWAFAGDQKITNLWNGVVTQTGKNVSVKDASWNKAIPTGGTAQIGFQATFSGTNAKPTAYTLNGVACTIQ